MTISYNALHVKVDPAHYEIVSAVLSQLPFDSFYEEENELIAYFENDSIAVNEISECLSSLTGIDNLSFEVKSVQNKNWNEEWESSFQPVNIDGKISIRADFHSKEEGVEHDIIINPKMAFGTAHHETTYMMMQEMLSVELNDVKVLDYGCGTSILAILAAQRGASTIIANDYDINSVTNSEENIELNQVGDIEVRHGSIDVITEDNFDVILANINRKVLTDTAQIISSKLVKGGVLLMSGILETDKELISSIYEPLLSLISIQQKGEWLCFKWEKQ